MIGITRGAQRVPNDRGRSWALANFTLPAADVFTFTPTNLPIRLPTETDQRKDGAGPGFVGRGVQEFGEVRRHC